MANAPSIWLDYRPIRIGWVLEGADLEQLYTAVGFNTCLWGGRFNPVIPIKDKKLAGELIKVFKVDVLLPVKASKETTSFIDSYPHLYLQSWNSGIFKKGECEFVDIRHPVSRLAQFAREKSHSDFMPINRPTWDMDDPLRVLFGIYFGHFPDFKEIEVNYPKGIKGVTDIEDVAIMKGADIHPQFLKKINPMSLTTYDLNLQNRGWSGWIDPCLVMGSPKSFDDMAFLWNIRAAGAQGFLLDAENPARHTKFLNGFISSVHQKLLEEDDHLKIWATSDKFDAIDLKKAGIELNGLKEGRCRIDGAVWNGMNIRPVKPEFTRWHHDVVPSFVDSGAKQKASFSIPQKPFDDERGAWRQQYVVSVTARQYGELPIDGLTFNTPYVPQMNEFYGRNFHFEYDKARAEEDSLDRGKIGIIKDVNDQQLTIHAISTHNWIKEFFQLFKIKASRSNPGLICSRLITQLGGIQGCRVFKIRGARELLEKYGPDQNFVRGEAERCIGNFDETSGKMNFDDYKSLYIEARKEKDLTPYHVFNYLLTHDVFRPGLEFKCSNCELASWVHLDEVKTISECIYCGHSFHVGSQLKDRGDWRYRRTGLFGRDDNQLGAIPVSLALQQLETALHGRLLMASTSINFEPDGADIELCEVDFLAIVSGAEGIGETSVQIVLGEAKTHQEFNEDDVRKLKKLADAISPDIAQVFILFAKTAAFTENEIKLAQQLNNEYEKRVVLWSDRELEPYHVYERSKDHKGKDIYATALTQMAQVTEQLWFSTKT